MCIPKADEDIIKFVNEGILFLHSRLVHFKTLVMIIKILFMAFMPSFEVFEVGFDDRVEGTRSINGVRILRTLSNFPACLLENTGLTIGNSDGRIHLLH